MLESYFLSPERSKVIKNDSVYKVFSVGGPRVLFLYQKCIFDIKITIFVKICGFWCQGPVKVPRSGRHCFWIRKTNGLRQPQMLEFHHFPIPATLFLRFSEKGSFAMEEIHSVSIFRSRAARARKTLYYQCFSIYFEGSLAPPG